MIKFIGKIILITVTFLPQYHPTPSENDSVPNAKTKVLL